MARHIWSVLCSRSIIDKESNQVTLVAVAEKLVIELLQPIPAGEEKLMFPYQMELVSLWERTEPAPELATVRIRFIAPNGAELAEQTVPIELTDRRFRSTFKFEALPIVGDGFCQTIVYLVNEGVFEEVARIPLEIQIKPPAIPAPRKTHSSKKTSRKTLLP